MKDIVIKECTVRKELFVLLGCFVLSCLTNLYTIIRYDRPMIEMLTSIGYVIVFALIIYLVLALLRIVVKLVMKLFGK